MDFGNLSLYHLYPISLESEESQLRFDIILVRHRSLDDPQELFLLDRAASAILNVTSRICNSFVMYSSYSQKGFEDSGKEVLGAILVVHILRGNVVNVTSKIFH